MTDNKTQITPPPHLMLRWQEEARDEVRDVANHFDRQSIQMIKAANWGWQQRDSSVADELQEARDEELEACCEWLELHYPHVYTTRLKRCRRPEPPSLKEQALQELDLLTADATTHGLGFDASAIRRALESLPD